MEFAALLFCRIPKNHNPALSPLTTRTINIAIFFSGQGIFCLVLKEKKHSILMNIN